MVGDDHENRVGPEGLRSGSLKKITQRPVSVADRVVALVGRGIFGNASGWVGERAVVRHRHEGGEKGFAGVVQRSHFFDAAVEQVFIADTPGGAERGMSEVGFLDQTLPTIEHRIAADVVEGTVTGIQKEGRVAVPPQYPRQGLHIFGLVAREDRISGQWGKTGVDRF